MHHHELSVFTQFYDPGIGPCFVHPQGRLLAMVGSGPGDWRPSWETLRNSSTAIRGQPTKSRVWGLRWLGFSATQKDRKVQVLYQDFKWGFHFYIHFFGLLQWSPGLTTLARLGLRLTKQGVNPRKWTSAPKMVALKFTNRPWVYIF